MGFNPFEELGKAAGGAAKFVQEKGGGAAKAAVDSAQAAAKVAGDGAAQIAKFAEGAVKVAVETIADAGKGAADAIQNDISPALQNGVNNAAHAANQLATDAKKMIFGPIPKEVAEAESFVLPLMIEVLPANNKRSVDLEFGSIGWKSTEGKIGVLHIYEDALDVLRCDLYPIAASKVGSVFFVDRLNTRRYINLAQYSEVIAEEKKTELLNIAYWLGAKRCHLECREEKLSVKSANIEGRRTLRFQVDGVPAKVAHHGEAEVGLDEYNAMVTLFTQEYGGNDNPQRPNLHWYEHDPRILQLIEARCDESNELKCYRAEISDAQRVTFDVNLAAQIDGALGKMKIDYNFSFEGQAKNEKRRKLTFVVEF